MITADTNIIALSTVCMAAVFFGGIVKGITGVGLPTVAIPLMAMTLPVPTAISLMSIPVLVSNILQIDDRRLARKALIRFWPLILLLVIGTAAGAQILVGANPRTTQIGLGLIIIGLVGFQELYTPPPSANTREWIWSPLIGLTAGLLGGISSFSGPPLVAYLLYLRLYNREFVVTISILYLFGAFSLYINLFENSHLGMAEVFASLALCPSAYGGLTLGRRLRGRLNEQQFRRTVSIILLLSSFSLLGKALL